MHSATGCERWSTVDLGSRGPSVAYVAIARSGSGTLQALLARLYGFADRLAFPHDHQCQLAELVLRFRPRRVLVPLRPLHERIESGVARAQRRNCTLNGAWQPACAPPRERAADRYVASLRRGDAAPTTFGRPALAYDQERFLDARERFSIRNVSVRPVCTHRLRADAVRAFAAWGVAGASEIWRGVADAHVGGAARRPSNLSAASLAYLRRRYARDYALVARHGCV